MVSKKRKGIISFLTIFILIQLSNELNVNKKNFIINIRKLQTTYNDTNSTNSTVLPDLPKVESKGGLSKGGIVAIVIPCIAALIAVGALAAVCRATPPPIQQNSDSSVFINLNNVRPQIDPVMVQQVPVQPVAVVQQVPVQPVTVVQEVPVQPVTVVEEVPVA